MLRSRYCFSKIGFKKHAQCFKVFFEEDFLLVGGGGDSWGKGTSFACFLSHVEDLLFARASSSASETFTP